MKYNCLNTNGELIGIVEADNEQQALDRARKLNKNVAGVEVREVAEHESAGPKGK